MRSSIKLEMSEGKDEFPEIDDKTKAVFNKKGYQLLGKIGSGAFGQVSVCYRPIGPDHSLMPSLRFIKHETSTKTKCAQ